MAVLVSAPGLFSAGSEGTGVSVDPPSGAPTLRAETPLENMGGYFDVDVPVASDGVWVGYGPYSFQQTNTCNTVSCFWWGWEIFIPGGM